MKNKPKWKNLKDCTKNCDAVTSNYLQNYYQTTIPKAPEVQSKFLFCGCNFYNPHLSQATAALKFVFLRESCYSEMNHSWISDTVLGTVVCSIFPW